MEADVQADANQWAGDADDRTKWNAYDQWKFWDCIGRIVHTISAPCDMGDKLKFVDLLLANFSSKCKIIVIFL